DVRLSDVVKERRLAVVDVTHDRDDRRTRHLIFGAVFRCFGDRLRLVRVLTHGLEPELARDQLDLIEVESQVDGHHQAEVLERERDDFRRRHADDLRELADGDEFVDVDGLALTLGLGRTRGLEIVASTASQMAARAEGWCAPQRSHCLRDVCIDRFLIDRPALAFLAATAAVGEATCRLRALIVAARWSARAASAGRAGCNRARREATAAGHWSRTRCAGRDRPRACALTIRTGWVRMRRPGTRRLGGRT